MAYLKADPDEVSVYNAILEEALRHFEVMQKNLAVLIANNLSRIFRK